MRDIASVTTIELKAIAYDLTVQIGNLQKNLQSIQAELTMRALKEAQENGGTKEEG